MIITTKMELIKALTDLNAAADAKVLICDNDQTELSEIVDVVSGEHVIILQGERGEFLTH